jgi:hypothetical protein
MGYPKNMNHEELHAFGFVVSPDDPTLAVHLVYPKLTCRYLCPTCNIWVGKISGGKVMQCDACRIGKKNKVGTMQFNKLYRCCPDQNCTSMSQAYATLDAFAVSWEPCHDGFGGYLLMNIPKSWTLDERCKFHSALANFCDSFQKARKVICSKKQKTRSKLPKSG